MQKRRSTLLAWILAGSLLLARGADLLAAGTEGGPQTGNPVVVMKTSEGPIHIELWAEKAPETVKNFLRYVDEGFYEGTIFHRVIDNFMIQGGGFTRDMKQKQPHEPIKNEATPDLKNDRGTIAMARTSVVDSATSQFFINVRDNDALNQRDRTPSGFGYAVFGKVIDGMDVVDRIRKVRTTSVGPHQNVPVNPVVIESVQRANQH
ncbi:MAG: peptidyl-prolyl cis-trans isomerase [Deltaproteobacteria bacterium]|nr:peptidyl-prolyl cis-trans isomerase [Deltaproteobacteria bacterium]